MTNFLKTKGIDILDIFVSKDHWKSQSFRRKPNPGMFLKFLKNIYLDLMKLFILVMILEIAKQQEMLLVKAYL